jgi:hypothetical protein
MLMFLYRSLDRRASQKRARVMRQRAHQTPERKKSGPPSGCHPTHGRGFLLMPACSDGRQLVVPMAGVGGGRWPEVL